MIRKIADGRVAPASGEVRAALPDTTQLSVSLAVAAVAWSSRLVAAVICAPQR